MNWLESPLLVAAISAGSVIAVALINRLVRERVAGEVIEHPVIQPLVPPVQLSQWSAVEAQICRLHGHTPFDRFMVFAAKNGRDAPKEVNEIYQRRTGEQEIYHYDQFPIDDDYCQRLVDMERNGVTFLDVPELPDSAIRDVYINEGVKQSLWLFIEAYRPIHDPEVRVLIFASYATHVGGLSDTDITKAKLVNDQVRQVLKQ